MLGDIMDMVEKKRIDEKHHIEARAHTDQSGLVTLEKVQIIKTSNGQPIPEDEPIILFRGRDRLAYGMLMHYRQLCIDDGCTDYQLESMDKMIKAFQDYASNHPEIMKQPGITLGK
jgi:hypothetical protein